MYGYYNGKQYDNRHGGPFDRGAADNYYRRSRNPHYYKHGTGNSKMFALADMTAEQIEAYNAGFDWNEQFGDKKDWS